MWLFGTGVDQTTAFLEKVGRQATLWTELSSMRMDGEVSRPRVTICCPISQSHPIDEMKSRVIMSHVLIDHDFSEDLFTSCNGEVVSRVDNDLILRTDMAEEERVQIVSVNNEEIPLQSFICSSVSLAADMKDVTVKVYNISRPFFGESRAPDNPDEVDYELMETYITLLRSHTEAQSILDGLDDYIEEVKTVSSSSENGLSRVSPSLSSSICTVWEENTTRLLSCDPSITEMITGTSASHSEYERILLGAVAESYVLHGVSDCVFEWISRNGSAERSKLVKIMSTIYRHTQNDLGIVPEFQVDQSRAVKELSRICAGLNPSSSADTPVDKLLILQRCVSMIREAIDRNVRENFPDKSDLEMSTDDLIMAIVWVVLQAFLTEGLDDLLSHIRYISQFHFVSSPTSRLEFVLCHFQVALSWLYKLGGFSTHELVFSEGGYFSTDGDDGGDGKTLGMFESTVTQAEGRITSYLALQEDAQAKRQGEEEEEEEEEESLHSLAFSLAVLGCGRQGHTTTLEKLKRFHGGRKRGIRSADSAADFGVVVCGDGSVHCFGEPDCGRLGIELAAEFDRVSPVRSPRLVESMDALRCSSGDGVKEARCGAKHALCLTESGGLYAWGDNRALQLGVSLSSSFAGTGTGRGIGRGTGKEEEEEGEMLDRPALLRAGGSLARAQELSLYGCCSPVRVHALHRVHVTAIACGSYHSLCLSGEGLVYSWGRSANGRLGHPPTPHGGHHTAAPFAPTAKPALVHCPRWLGGGSGREDSDGEGQGRGRSRVVQISAGHAHSVALTDDGKAFTWGAGLHGRLGQGCHTDQPMPCSVSVFEKCRVHIAAASAGWAHTVFLSREGALFGTGLRAMGQLGPHVASAETEVDETGRSGAFEALWPLPLPLQALEGGGGGGGDGGGRARMVRCGAFHTVVMEQRGTILRWGQDDNGTPLESRR